MLTRKEAYAVIKANPAIKELIKTKYGVNYTNTPTEVLVKYIDDFRSPRVKKISEKADITIVDIKPQVVSCENVVAKLCEVLVNKKILLKKEKEYILS